MPKKSLRKKYTCQICGESLDVYTTCHSKKKFVDNKFYDKICFTCYFVPKIMEQVYGKDGSVVEEKELEYCCSNLNSPKELYEVGNAETLRQAKKSHEAVLNACKNKHKSKEKLVRPKAEWYIV